MKKKKIFFNYYYFLVVRAQLSRMYEIGSTEMRRGVRFLGNPGRTATPRLVN